MRMVPVKGWDDHEIHIDADKVLTVREWREGIVMVRFVGDSGEFMFKDSVPNFLYRIAEVHDPAR